MRRFTIYLPIIVAALLSMAAANYYFYSNHIGYAPYEVNIANGLFILLLLFLIRLHTHKTLQQYAGHDPLTTLHNRAEFERRLEAEIHRTKRYDRPMSLIFFAVDNLGESAVTPIGKKGDSVLRELSLLSLRSIRKSDVLCRIGRDEFAVIATETTLENTGVLAEKIRRIIKNTDFRNGHKITVSLGVVQHKRGMTPEDLINAANNCLATAKSKGPDTVHTCS